MYGTNNDSYIQISSSSYRSSTQSVTRFTSDAPSCWSITLLSFTPSPSFGSSTLGMESLFFLRILFHFDIVFPFRWISNHQQYNRSRDRCCCHHDGGESAFVGRRDNLCVSRFGGSSVQTCYRDLTLVTSWLYFTTAS